MYLFAVGWLKLMDTRRLRLLLFYNWIVACSLFSGVNGGKPACHELPERVVLTDDADICVPNVPADPLGNYRSPVILDFSTAKKDTFELLTKGFVEIAGAFVMDGNEQVETLNFGEIKRFEGKKLVSGSNFISIRNNPNLKKLEWNASVTDISLNDGLESLHILIYNNPQLDVASFKMIYDAARRKSNIVRSFQDSAGECRFQNEHNDAEYFPPTADILKNCKKIKGDFKMTGGSLAGLSIDLTRDSCLQLINVDMTGAKLTLNTGKLSPICKDKSTSKISNNKKLCGFQLGHLEKSFNKPEDVAIDMDKPSCVIKCITPAEKSHKYYICNNQETTTTATADSFTTDRGKNNNRNNNKNNNNGNNNIGNGSKSKQNAKDPPWIVIGCCVAVGFVLIVLIIIFVFYKKKMLCFKKTRKLKRTTRTFTKAEKIALGEFQDTFGEKMRKSVYQFIMDASILDINTMRNKFAAVDKIVVDEKTREKPPKPWKSSKGAALGSLVTVDKHEYLIGSRPKDKETAIAFWEYAHDHLVRHFILIDAGKGFIPIKLGETVDLGPIKIILEDEEPRSPLFTSRTVRINRSVNGKRWEWKLVVDHLAGWTDEIPSSIKIFYDLFSLWEMLNWKKTYNGTTNLGKPKDKEERHMIVCSDGKERTGAILLLELVWNELIKVDNEDQKSINVEALLARLRTQIPSAISNFRIYLFWYLLLVTKMYQTDFRIEVPHFPEKFVQEALATLGLKDQIEICRGVLGKTSTSKQTKATTSENTVESSHSTGVSK